MVSSSVTNASGAGVDISPPAGTAQNTDELTNSSAVSGTTATDALNTLNTSKAAASHSHTLSDITDSGTMAAQNSVLYSHLPTQATNTFLGRDTAGTGAPEVLTRAMAQALLNLPMTFLEDHGDYVDEDTDYKSAFTAAALTGKHIMGRGDRVYGISGDWQYGASVEMSNVTIKQLDPGKTNRRTITSSINTSCKLWNVKVLRNGDGTHTGGTVPTIGDADHGIYISDGGHVSITQCEVTGDGFGRGIFVSNAVSGGIYNCYVHTMKAGTSSYTAFSDDVLEGIGISACTDFSVVNNHVKALTTQDTGRTETNIYTRGISVSGANDNTPINSNKIQNVDQAIDITGDGGPSYGTVNSNVIRNCLSHGVKFANSAQHWVCTGNFIDTCGIRGVVLSVPGTDLTGSTIPVASCTGYITVKNNRILNTGANNDGRASTTTAGVSMLSGHSAYSGYPRGVVITENEVFGKSDLSMDYGFYTDTSYGGQPHNICQRNRVHFAGTSRMSGFTVPVCRTYRSSSFSVANNAFTAIELNAEHEDSFGSHDNSTNPSRHTSRSEAYYDIFAQIYWAGNSSGARIIQIYVNGSAVAHARRDIRPHDANEFVQAVELNNYPLNQNDYVEVRAFQNSGGSLNALATLTWFSMGESGVTEY